MNPKTNLRIVALQQAVATTGNSNKLQVAGEYFDFLVKDVDEPAKQQAPAIDAAPAKTKR